MSRTFSGTYEPLNFSLPSNSMYRTLKGTYEPLNFPLPSNSQAAITLAVDAVKAMSSARAGLGAWSSRSAYASRRRTISGIYDRGLLNRYGTTPQTYLGAGVSEVAEWMKQNPILAAVVGLGAVLLVGMGGKRRR